MKKTNKTILWLATRLISVMTPRNKTDTGSEIATMLTERPNDLSNKVTPS